MTTRPRVHNEWFMPLARRTCPCGQKKTEVFGWGEYVIGKWRTIDHFCRHCFTDRVLSRLLSHASGCGCTFQLVARRGYRLPDWIVLPACAVTSQVA